MDREEWNRRYADAELLWTAIPNQTLVREVELLLPRRGARRSRPRRLELGRGLRRPQDASILFTPDDVVADIAEVTSVIVERAERVERRVSTDTGDRNAIDALVRAASVG